MAKWDSMRKTERDNEIRKYARDNPDLSQQEIADKYGISRSNISRIINMSGKKKVK